MVKLPDAMKIYHCLFTWLGKCLIKPAAAVFALPMNISKLHSPVGKMELLSFKKKSSLVATLLKHTACIHVIELHMLAISSKPVTDFSTSVLWIVLPDP